MRTRETTHCAWSMEREGIAMAKSYSRDGRYDRLRVALDHARTVARVQQGMQEHELGYVVTLNDLETELAGTGASKERSSQRKDKEIQVQASELVA